jgi:signal transduction histidine kinase
VVGVVKQRFTGGLTPFTVIAVGVAFLLVLMPSQHRHYGELIVACFVGIGIIGLALAARRVPRLARLAIPLGYIGLAALLRDSLGGGVSGFGGLFLLPILWLALSANRGELFVGLAAMALALVLPIAVQGAPDYPSSGWRGAIVLVAVGVIASLTIQTLLAELQRRAVELEHANRQLAEQNVLKEQFVSLAAHELRTPVTTIYGFATTLNERAGRLSEEQQAILRRELADQSSRMAVLVEQLLDLSRLDAAAVDVVPSQVNVREAVESLLPAVVDGAAPDVRLDIRPSLVAEIDSHIFERIVMNLVTNAVRYGEPPFVIRAEEASGNLRVVVEDHGPGVPNSFVPILFERFSRSDASRHRAPGPGLGLAIARSYARAHRGDLVYEPLTPSGSRFQLVLPARVAVS